MIHGSVAVPDPQARGGGDDGADVPLGGADRFEHRVALRKAGGDCRRKRASRPVRVARFDSLFRQLFEVLSVIEEVRAGRRVLQVPAFDHDAARPQGVDGPCRPAHPVPVGDGKAAEHLRLGKVRCHHGRQGQEGRDQGATGLRFKERITALRHHDRIDDQGPQAVLADLCRNDIDDRPAGKHARLHGIGPDVLHDGVDLPGHELGRDRKHTFDSHRVLRRQRRDGAGSEDAERRECFQVCLDPGTPAGIRSGNRHRTFHFVPAFFPAAKWSQPDSVRGWLSPPGRTSSIGRPAGTTSPITVTGVPVSAVTLCAISPA